jgi:exosortase
VVLLEACGTTVSRQGNIVTLNDDTPLEVAEACSGLRMLIAFVIAAALIAYLVKRPRWQKAILLASGIPVAVICNVIRIFATALFTLYVNSEVGLKFFHDVGGFVMIAVAVSLLFGEIQLMDRLVVSESSTQPQQIIVSVRTTANSGAKLARSKG